MTQRSTVGTSLAPPIFQTLRPHRKQGQCASKLLPSNSCIYELRFLLTGKAAFSATRMVAQPCSRAIYRARWRILRRLRLRRRIRFLRHLARMPPFTLKRRVKVSASSIPASAIDPELSCTPPWLRRMRETGRYSCSSIAAFTAVTEAEGSTSRGRLAPPSVFTNICMIWLWMLPSLAQNMSGREKRTRAGHNRRCYG